MDKKPNVFPTQVKTTETNAQTNIEALNQGQIVPNNDPIGNSSQYAAGEVAASEEMRRRTAKKIAILPDPRFKEEMVTKFVNNLMLDGKISLAF